MNEQFWTQVVVYGVTLLVASLRFGFLVGRIENNCVTKQELKDKVRERDEKIERVYTRFDDFKRIANDAFVRKDMCGQLHVSTREEVKKLDEDYKAFRHDIRNAVQKISDEIVAGKEWTSEKLEEIRKEIRELIQKKG